MSAKYAVNNHQSVSCDEYLRQMRRKRRVSACLPEHQVVSGRMRRHGVPDVLVDLCPLIQGLHRPALEQVLVPVALLPQQARQSLLGSRRQLHSHLPQPQGKTIMHLEKQIEIQLV